MDDLVRASNILGATSLTIETEKGLPDVTLEFDSDLTLDQIKTKIKQVPDGHVMIQTIKPALEYTGIRDYNS